jgi:hypothetical protein
MLTHYVIVRRDLSIGDVVAQVAHAAGESFYKFAMNPRSSVGEHQRSYDREDVGSIPAAGFKVLRESASGGSGSGQLPGSSVSERLEDAQADGCAIRPRGANSDVSDTIVVVLGARNEHKLLRLETMLIAAAVAHVAIRETDGSHAGHLMAIGLLPASKEAVENHLREFHMLRQCLGTISHSNFTFGSERPLDLNG